MKKTGKIAYSLIGAFLIPVCLMILLGVLSYQSATRNITRQYEDSIKGSLITVSEYCSLLCSNVEDKATEIVANDSFATYYDRYAGSNSGEAMEYARTAAGLLNQAKATCDYIYSYHVFSENGGNITSGSKQLPGTAYEEFAGTKEAQSLTKGKGIWSGYHSYLDETLSLSPDSYALSYTRMLTKGNGYFCMDIDAKTVQNTLMTIDTGDGTISALVTPDGREFIYSEETAKDAASFSPEEPIFVGTDYYEKALQENQIGTAYITFQGKSYLFAYTPVGATGIMLCTLVPHSTILSTASSIRSMTVIMVILACVIALIIGSIMARNIGKEVTTLTRSLDKVSDGDFTTVFASRRRDEFRLLAMGMAGMLGNIREIIARSKKFAGKVNDSSEEFSDTALLMVDSMRDINTAMEEVASGVAKQAQDAEESLKQISAFSERLNEAHRHTLDIEKSSEEAMYAVENGRMQADKLNQKTEAAETMTNRLVTDITAVAENSKDIGSIIATIQEIAEQTNLLSLNASIEAARAGEAGRGFAVVAEEIRALAEQSSQAGDRIRDIVGNIQMTTDQTVNCAQNTKNYLQEQTVAIGETVQVFEQIAGNVEQMVCNLRMVAQDMSDMVANNDVVLDSIRSIASVSEQASSSTEEVTATVNGQLTDMKKLADEAQKLSEEVQQLNDSMQRFTV